MFEGTNDPPTRYPSKSRSGTLTVNQDPFSTYSLTTCKGDTGFSEHELQGFYDIVDIDLPRVPNRKYWFFTVLLYIHRAPTHTQWAAVMRTKVGAVPKTSFYKYAIPLAECIAKHSSSKIIDWASRLAPDNTAVIFPANVTGIVDGFPVMVSEPVNKLHHKCLNSGKYKATCLKGELFIDWKGHITGFAWPFVGVRHDAAIRDVVATTEAWLPGERAIGDRAYKASPNIITGYVSTKAVPLTSAQKKFNFVFNSVRQRVSTNIINLIFLTSILFAG